jgi:hypothetical protein
MVLQGTGEGKDSFISIPYISYKLHDITMSSSKPNSDLEPDYSRKYTESKDAPFYVHDIGSLIPSQVRKTSPNNPH